MHFSIYSLSVFAVCELATALLGTTYEFPSGNLELERRSNAYTVKGPVGGVQLCRLPNFENCAPLFSALECVNMEAASGDRHISSLRPTTGTTCVYSKWKDCDQVRKDGGLHSDHGWTDPSMIGFNDTIRSVKCWATSRWGKTTS
ncbi:hypothetical protein K469DRAFT_694085 [Zopfia rhizophila CBS 207.26]|uniref:Uncharacterized protein n=1 Tax=Zopfia rhizophila CBS 207.26 TaxID=1314779 RepID=A0A6A6DMD4_9PEZI|nr:hypothetical protein K469DRAFT_694085 [Zopfia rhizophila CBS 207.26]